MYGGREEPGALPVRTVSSEQGRGHTAKGRSGIPYQGEEMTGKRGYSHEERIYICD